MSIKFHQSLAEANPFDDVDGLDDSLIDKIWHDLGGQLPRERVNCVVAEVALGFQNATVKTFLPVLVHRRALERLKQELSEISSAVRPLLDEH